MSRTASAPAPASAQPASPAPSKSVFLTADDVHQMSAGVGDIQAGLRNAGVTLTTEQIYSLTKPRFGGDEFVNSVVQLALSHGVDFPASPLGDILPALQSARLAQPILNVLGHVVSTLTSTIAQFESDAWSSALMYYGVMDQLADKNPQLNTEIQPLRDIMGHRSAPVLAKRAVAKQQREAKKLEDKAAKKRRRAATFKGASPDPTATDGSGNDTGGTGSNGTATGNGAAGGATSSSTPQPTK